LRAAKIKTKSRIKQKVSPAKCLPFLSIADLTFFFRGWGMTSTPNLVRNLAANLKTLLAETGMSQRELARRANIDPMALNNAVNGKSLISTLYLYRLSLVLDRPMNWLVSDQSAGKTSRKKNGSAA